MIACFTYNIKTGTRPTLGNNFKVCVWKYSKYVFSAFFDVTFETSAMDNMILDID